jgi:hypothetical protein
VPAADLVAEGAQLHEALRLEALRELRALRKAAKRVRLPEYDSDPLARLHTAAAFGEGPADLRARVTTAAAAIDALFCELVDACPELNARARRRAADIAFEQAMRAGWQFAADHDHDEMRAGIADVLAGSVRTWQRASALMVDLAASDLRRRADSEHLRAVVEDRLAASFAHQSGGWPLDQLATRGRRRVAPPA